MNAFICGQRKVPVRRAAFTLVEVMVSMAVLSVLLLISAQVIGQVQNTWTASNARVSQFREARTAFDILTRNLSQATLNTFIDYDTNYLAADAAAADNPAGPQRYQRNSDLQFVCGPASGLLPDAGGPQYLPGSAVFFQAPLGISQQPSLVGLERLLCGRGYFVQFSNDAFFKPEWLAQSQPRFRYRLMEFCPPAEKNSVYAVNMSGGERWFKQAGSAMKAAEDPTNLSLNRPVADNIVTLVVSPREETARQSINGKASFDSSQRDGSGAQGTQHLLPPMLKIVLVAIDERSAERLANYDTNSEPPLSPELSAFHSTLGEAIDDQALEQGLNQLRTDFVKKRINYRVFSTTVQIRASKWSVSL
jgi:uncharacterized protein (TIGR02599 family)